MDKYQIPLRPPTYQQPNLTHLLSVYANNLDQPHADLPDSRRLRLFCISLKEVFGLIFFIIAVLPTSPGFTACVRLICTLLNTSPTHLKNYLCTLLNGFVTYVYMCIKNGPHKVLQAIFPKSNVFHFRLIILVAHEACYCIIIACRCSMRLILCVRNICYNFVNDIISLVSSIII